MPEIILIADAIYLHCSRMIFAQTQTYNMVCAGSEMLLADDIESFWLAGPCSSGSSDLAAPPTQLDRAYSHGSSALSRSASIAHSVGRHPTTSEGQLKPFVCRPSIAAWHHTMPCTMPCGAMPPSVLKLLQLTLFCRLLTKVSMACHHAFQTSMMPSQHVIPLPLLLFSTGIRYCPSGCNNQVCAPSVPASTDTHGSMATAPSLFYKLKMAMPTTILDHAELLARTEFLISERERGTAMQVTRGVM